MSLLNERLPGLKAMDERINSNGQCSIGVMSFVEIKCAITRERDLYNLMVITSQYCLQLEKI